jgi:hypothetical protein
MPIAKTIEPRTAFHFMLATHFPRGTFRFAVSLEPGHCVTHRCAAIDVSVQLWAAWIDQHSSGRIMIRRRKPPRTQQTVRRLAACDKEAIVGSAGRSEVSASTGLQRRLGKPCRARKECGKSTFDGLSD